jgi:hypothetical protein
VGCFCDAQLSSVVQNSHTWTVYLSAQKRDP